VFAAEKSQVKKERVGVRHPGKSRAFLGDAAAGVKFKEKLINLANRPQNTTVVGGEYCFTPSANLGILRDYRERERLKLSFSRCGGFSAKGNSQQHTHQSFCRSRALLMPA
jgi:hypothetical protein